jgi:hypothetical protein
MLNAVLPMQRKLAIVFVTVALLPIAGTFAVHAWRNRAPDNWRELRSPDGHYRLIITEEGAGAPGRICLKDMYVVPVTRELDRADEDSHVFAGACGGLLDVNWSGRRIEAHVDHRAARQGGVDVVLRDAAAGGKIKVQWSP